MRHRPVEEIGRSIRELSDRKRELQVVSQRFKGEKDVPLLRLPVRRRRHVAHIEIPFVEMEDESVAFVHFRPVGSRHAISHFTTGANERLLTEAKVHVAARKKARPIEDYLNWLMISRPCSVFNHGVSSCY